MNINWMFALPGWRYGKGAFLGLTLTLVLVLGNGCSIRKLTMNKLGDVLAQSGTTFTSDEDPDLIRAAVPFSLKLMESILAENPHHVDLLLATCRSFTQYTYAFVQMDADEIQATDLSAALALKKRAQRLYLRARNYGLKGLEVKHPGFGIRLHTDARRAVEDLAVEDVPLLYWTSVAWSAAIAQAKDSPDMIADLPLVEALIDRALDLNEAYDDGSLHAFLVNFELARQASGAAEDRVKPHFNRAIELSQGQSAAPWVSYAEAVCVQKQDVKEFEAMLERALQVDPEARPEWRLENLVMQRRARWLLSQVDDLFLILEEAEPAK